MTDFENSLTRGTLRCLSDHMPYFNGKKRNGQNRIIHAGEAASEKLVIHNYTYSRITRYYTRYRDNQYTICS